MTQIDLRSAWQAIESIEDRRIRNMTHSALMATIAGLTRRKEPLPDGLPVTLYDFMVYIHNATEGAVQEIAYEPITRENLMQRAEQSATDPYNRLRCGDVVPPVLTEMFGYAFSHIEHLAYLAAGNEPTPWE